MFRNISISKRLWFILLIAIFMLLAVGSLAIKQNYQSLLNGKKIKTQHLVETTTGIFEQLYAQEQAGTLTREQAQQQAIIFIKQLRYDDNDYFFIHDLSPKMIMHPMNPALDAKDLSNFKDPSGKAVFVEFAQIARQQGHGFVEYLWPKPGAQEPVDKINYVKLFKPWGWVLGTGVYLDDIQAEFHNSIKQGALASFLILVILGLLVTAIIRSITQPLDEAVHALENIASGDGDLTIQLAEQGTDELAKLSNNFNLFTSKLRNIIEQLLASANALSTSADALGKTAHGTLNYSQSQLAETEQIATAINEVTYAVQDVAQHANQAAQAVSDANEQASIGQQSIQNSLQQAGSLSQSIRQAVSVMQSLAEQSNQIEGVLDVIRSIAEQTNLLALNAAIEAARAGEQGRGFAVVADEVRSLAQRTQQSTDEVHSMIESLQSKSQAAVVAIQGSNESAQQTVVQAQIAGENFLAITQALEVLNDLNTSIASSTLQQSHAAEEINQNVTRVAGLSHDTTSAAQSSTQASEQLKSLAHELSQLLTQFKI